MSYYQRKSKKWGDKTVLTRDNALLDKYLDDETSLSSSELKYLKRKFPDYFGGRKKRRRKSRRKTRRKTRRKSRRKSRRKTRRRRRTRRRR